MKISQLPQEVKEKALKYQRIARKGCGRKTDRLDIAFDWYNTKEGGVYWEKWHEKEFKETEK
jgi:hypothetical protein